MKYYWLVPKDQRFNNWLFYDESEETGIHLREQYLPWKCPKCRKISELEAIATGISGEAKIRSKSDYLMTDDGLVCLSIAGQQIFAEAGLTGLQFVPLPADARYALALPCSFVPTDKERTQMEFHRPCPNCGRFRETCLYPALASMSLPSDKLEINCPEVAIEGSQCRNLFYLISEDAAALLKRSKLTGVEYRLAY